MPRGYRSGDGNMQVCDGLGNLLFKQTAPRATIFSVVLQIIQKHIDFKRFQNSEKCVSGDE